NPGEPLFHLPLRTDVLDGKEGVDMTHCDSVEGASSRIGVSGRPDVTADYGPATDHPPTRGWWGRGRGTGRSRHSLPRGDAGRPRRAVPMKPPRGCLTRTVTIP